jgi:hypothetical protein
MPTPEHQDEPLLHHDRLGTIFHHLHRALVELEHMIREERDHARRNDGKRDEA